jgi:hypothetical protein
MKAVIRDIWEYKDTHWIVIPTNLQGPMGRGLAQQAKVRWPGLELRWKRQCAQESRVVFWFGPDHNTSLSLVLFPVKYRWKESANLKLIEESLEAISDFEEPVAIPQIGCGFGERDWAAEIEPLVEKYLGGKDNFLLVIMPDSVKTKYPKSFLPVRVREYPHKRAKK